MAACEASARGNYTAEPRGRALCELSGLGSLLAWEPAGLGACWRLTVRADPDR